MFTIGHIVEEAEWIDEQVKNKEVNQKFVQQPTLRGIVIVKDQTPVGHIPRSHFYQKIGTLYGYNLYMGRANTLLAKANPLVVDVTISLADASKLAMARNEEDLYDDLIVTENNCFVGIVSVRTLLLKLAEAEITRASALNPLSSLPGNQMINHKINDLLSAERFSLIYIDVDRFKIFNDLYGFNRGDKVLLYLTTILKKCVLSQDDFLGHIGGDDFVIVVPHFDVTLLCENIITHFQKSIHQFYDAEHLEHPPIVKDRNGNEILLEPMTLSIAVVSNEHQIFADEHELSHTVAQVKKRCKMQEDNSIIFHNPALAIH
ncbi:GGDEF domain-containing protein [Solibacillus sp. MA9]|uniref:GGDEF domain-containing protein n=1 Tax=Solibacillus palustris TaxID=2908203 RepID=A0ABS9UB18_9BACL|nr:GGDEF domain-containing protein [Solibacillus sp. MA9]MCH7321369.1 GGDEF domain-containing protein [Solibacillus sp. MA9]